jgi:hypothetical protein
MSIRIFSFLFLSLLWVPRVLDADPGPTEQTETVPKDSQTVSTEATAPEEKTEYPGSAPQDVDSVEYKMWVDDMRDWLYGISHGTVEWADTRFVDENQQEVVPTPPSRFRIGILSSIELKPEGDIKFAPDADFAADVELPNLEERLKLFITTRDPTALTGTDAFDQDNDIRVGASRGFGKNIDTSVGVKAKWLPEVFAFVKWNPKYDVGPHWDLFPEWKVFWESEDKLGGQLALTAGRWNGNFLFRQSMSGKVTQNDADEDEEVSQDPDSFEFGEDGKGVRWQSTTTFGYVTELLAEEDYGRLVNGEDVAKGYGIRGQIQGNAASSLQAKATLFLKRPLYKDFLFYIISPEVIWNEEDSWDEEFVLRVGLDLLLWGDETYRAAP